MFLNLLPHFVCTRCLLWRSALLYALRLAVAYPLGLLLLALALLLAALTLALLGTPAPLTAEMVG